MTFEDELIIDLGRFSKDPLGFVLWAFPWNTTNLPELGPEEWQYKVLRDVRDGLLSLEGAIQVAVVSGNGVGKSALTAWLILWAMSTREDTLGVITANTENQLKTKTWASVGKWFHLFIAKQFFTLTATALISKDPTRERTWRCDIVPWSEKNAVAFQGLHNKGKRLFMFFDEASGIADVIWEAAEGCFTDADTEMLWMATGNPNLPTGRFRECFPGGKYSHRWRTTKVDSRTVSFTDKNKIQEWLEDEGEDSDFFRVRVKGEFPRAGVVQFIGPDLVQAARKREIERLDPDALVMGVDVGRFGDDATRIVFRRGRDAKTLPYETIRGQDTVFIAARVAELAAIHQPDAIMVDGGGVGGGVVDQLRALRVDCFDIQFGSKPTRINPENKTRYANKRAEMWGWMKDWLKGGAIPDEDFIEEELTGPMYGYVFRDGQDAILLEKKEDMKKRGLSSPDWGDALALTFAYAVAPLDRGRGKRPDELVQSDYDPFSQQLMAA